MHCLITAGPTYEKLDDVRRLTNFSTGRLGTELAAHLTNAGHDVTLLVGELATWRGERIAKTVETFATTADLLTKFQTLADDDIGAVFHAAAVSDFSFGGVFEQNVRGELHELKEGKISTRAGEILARLVPTPKLISRLREFYPAAVIVGWKYEVDGSRDDVIAKTRRQIAENRTTASVANGRAYGEGFGVVDATGQWTHAANSHGLFQHLARLVGT
jgi:phosphopantothenoylcysteine synthetase/decarboxylase